MNSSSAKGATSWLRDFTESSAAVVEVITPEIKHGLRRARKASSSHAEGITGWQGAKPSSQRKAVSHYAVAHRHRDL